MTSKEKIEALNYIWFYEPSCQEDVDKREAIIKELKNDLERLEKQDKILSILKNNTKLVDYKENGSTQAFKIIIEDKFTIEEDGEYVTCRNSDFDDIKEWLDGSINQR